MAGLGSTSGFPETPPSFKALLSGSSIPRNLTKIPKEQQKLLDRPDSWSVAFKGSNKAANVPPEVVQSLKDFHAAHTLPPPAQRPQAPVSSAPSLTAPRKVNNVSDEGEISPDSSAPGSPSSVGGSAISWSSSPERGRNLTARNSSPAPSIRSQIGIESQFPVPSPTAGLPSSPPQCPSSPILLAPKRYKPPTNSLQPNLKRPRIGTFPSSSAGGEDEMETCIPDAINQATPPIRTVAARLLRASQAVTSPPCGQGNMIASTYSDAKSFAMSSTPKKRRSMKVIAADDWSSSASTPGKQPIIPLSQPRENPIPASSGPCIASTYTADYRKPLEDQVVQETPGEEKMLEETTDDAIIFRGSNNAKSLREERHMYQESQDSLPGADRSGLIMAADVEMSGNSENLPLGGNKQGLHMGEVPKVKVSRNELETWLDDTYGAERPRVEWLPTDLQHLRPTLSKDSLQTLKRITLLADKRGVALGSLWSAPDGPLRRGVSVQKNGKLSFRMELIHRSMNFVAEAARQVKDEKRALEKKKQEDERAMLIAKAAAARFEQSRKILGADDSPAAKLEDSEDDLPEAPQPALSPAEMIAAHFTQNPFRAFCTAYPTYSGSLMDFVRACMVVDYLQRNQKLPKWLYDDFIRAFGDGYIQYMDQLDKSDAREKPIPAIRWYVGNVDKPVFQKDVVTVANLSRVFELYPEESNSAKVTIPAGISPSPATNKPSIALPTTSTEKSNTSHITTPPPADRAKPAQDAASIPLQISPPQARRVFEGHIPSQSGEVIAIDEQDLATTSPIVETLSVEPEPEPEPEPSPAKQDKGKQRMTDQEPRSPQEPETPKTQHREAPICMEDDNIVFLSSNPRLRPAPPNVIEKGPSIKQESPNGHKPQLFSRATPQQGAPVTNQTNATYSQRLRAAIVEETPRPSPRTTRESPRAEIEKPPVRRTLPPAFDLRASSRPAPHSPAHSVRSTLSASTQDSRVKKPKKTEAERQRDNERWKRKITKMAREGRLPGSTPAPNGGDA